MTLPPRSNKWPPSPMNDNDLAALSSLARVLIVAGSDSGGGAGIQADIKTVTALRAYAATAVTAVTVQNTQGVSDVVPIPAETVAAQMRAVLSDIGADAIKLGMLHSTAVIEAVAQEIDALDTRVDLVVDPVMVATSGDKLLQDDAVIALRNLLVPAATLLTPNMPEAAVLTGKPVETLDDQKRAGDALMGLGPRAVLIKGGHGSDDVLYDVLVTEESIEVMTGPRFDTKHTHGTGCTLASAVAALLAQGVELREAVYGAREFVQAAIQTAPGFGNGSGPLNHMYRIPPIDAE